MRHAWLASFVCLLIMLVAETEAYGAKKKHGLCSDYNSRTNIVGKPYYIRDPEDGRVVRRHNGMDFCAKAGSDVLAAADGVIVRIEWDNPTRGGWVELRTKIFAENDQKIMKPVFIRHLHIDPVRSLIVGQEVKAGMPIGKVQKAGKEQIGPVAHVHFDAGNCLDIWLCHLNPNKFWADGPGKIACFDDKNPPPADKLVAPVRC
jgi:murein DD-endopeptidase MepM/ murein hydrolase activator NlpD